MHNTKSGFRRNKKRYQAPLTQAQINFRREDGKATLWELCPLKVRTLTMLLSGLALDRANSSLFGFSSAERQHIADVISWVCLHLTIAKKCITPNERQGSYDTLWEDVPLNVREACTQEAKLKRGRARSPLKYLTDSERKRLDIAITRLDWNLNIALQCTKYETLH